MHRSATRLKLCFLLTWFFKLKIERDNSRRWRDHGSFSSSYPFLPLSKATSRNASFWTKRCTTTLQNRSKSAVFEPKLVYNYLQNRSKSAVFEPKVVYNYLQNRSKTTVFEQKWCTTQAKWSQFLTQTRCGSLHNIQGNHSQWTTSTKGRVTTKNTEHKIWAWAHLLTQVVSRLLCNTWVVDIVSLLMHSSGPALRRTSPDKTGTRPAEQYAVDVEMQIKIFCFVLWEMKDRERQVNVKFNVEGKHFTKENVCFREWNSTGNGVFHQGFSVVCKTVPQSIGNHMSFDQPAREQPNRRFSLEWQAVGFMKYAL